MKIINNLKFVIVCLIYLCCVSHATEIVWYTLTSSQLSSLDANVFTSITPKQLSQIPATSCNGFKQDQISKLNSTACSGFSASQLSNLATSYPSTVSAAFTEACFVNIPPQSLSLISASFLGYLNGLVFNSMSTLQVQSLPNEAFKTVSPDLLRMVNAQPVCSGFKSGQMSNLDSSYPRYACSGFVGQCISFMDSNSFSGFNKDCVKQLTDSALSSISSDQVSQIPSTSFSGFTSDNIKYLSPSGCSGITVDQMANLENTYPTYACSGFAGQCISQISAGAFSGMKTDCVKQLTNSALSSFSSGKQVSQIPSTSFSGFTSDNIKYLSTTGCSGITATQMANLDNTYPSYACSGITKDCLGAIPATSFTQLTKACVNKLTSNSLSGLSKDQMSNFAPVSFSGFTSDNINGLSIACQGILGSQISNLDNTYPSYACQGMTSECMSNIPSQSFNSIQPTCINMLSSSATHALSKDQVSNIAKSAMSGFNSGNLVGLTSSCAGLSSVQIAQFDTSYPSLACQGIKGDCISNIPNDAFSGFTSKCVSQIDATAAASIEKDQISMMTTSGVSGFVSDQIANLNSNACSGFKPDQIGSLNADYPNTACYGLKKMCINGLELKSIPAFSSKCFSQIPVESISGFSPSAIPVLSPDSLSGMNGDQLVEFYRYFGLYQFVNVLSQKQVERVPTLSILTLKENLEKQQLSRSRIVSDSESSTLTWLQLSASTDESVKNVLKDTLVPSILPQTFRGLLNYSQILPDNFYTSFSLYQLDNLLSDTISSITQVQIETITSSAFLSPHSLYINFRYINNDAIKGVTQDQFNQLVANGQGLENSMTCGQFNSLTAQQYNFLFTFKSYSTIYQRCYRPSPQPSNNPPPNPPPTPPTPPPNPLQSKINPKRSNNSMRNYGYISFVLVVFFTIIVC